MHTICPGPGQGVTSIHPAASLQPATNWWDNKHNSTAKFSLSESIQSSCNDWKLFSAMYHWLFTGLFGFVFFLTFIAAMQASNWGFGVSGQRKLENSHILVEKDWYRENESLVRIDFSILENKLEPHTHTHCCWTIAFHLLIHTANNTVICHQGFVTIIIYWPSWRTAALSCFIPFRVHTTNATNEQKQPIILYTR